MPYKTIKDLPETFNNLPDGAKKIALEVINKSLADGDDDETAIKKAWGAVKESYEEKDGEWVEKKKQAKRYVKDVIRPGTYYGAYYGDPEKEWTVTVEDFNRWIKNTEGQQVNVWIPYGYHSDDPRLNSGWVEKFYVENDTLMALMDIQNPEVIAAIDNGQVKEVSIAVDKARVNDEGKTEEVIQHLAIVLDPVVTGQGDFIPISSGENIAEFSHSKLKRGEKVMSEPIKEPENLSEEGKTLWKAITGLFAGLTKDYEGLKAALAEFNKEKPDEPKVSEELEPVLTKVKQLESQIRTQRLDKAGTIIGLKSGTPEEKASLKVAYEAALNSGDEKSVEAIETYINGLKDDHKASAQFGPKGPGLPSDDEDEEIKKIQAEKNCSYTEAFDEYYKAKKDGGNK